MSFIINDGCTVNSIPKKIKKSKEKIRFECVLQTCDVKNRNGRMYPKSVLDESIQQVMPRVKNGSFLGELDHPIDNNPVRQVTVRYHDAGHRILEMGWEGNKLVGVLESLRTPNGTILMNLAEDGIPIGFSYRGMGDAEKTEDSNGIMQVIKSPLMTITYDSVTFPSHEGAHLIKITENVNSTLTEHVSLNACKPKSLIETSILFEDDIYEENGMVCTSEGICFLPDAFDVLVQRRILSIKKKFQI